jgi:hypothetical protein
MCTCGLHIGVCEFDCLPRVVQGAHVDANRIAAEIDYATAELRQFQAMYNTLDLTADDRQFLHGLRIAL